MKTFKSLVSATAVFGVLASLVFFTGLSPAEVSASVDKLDTEEILERHLKSIGTKEARESVVSIMASGTARAVFKGRGAGETAGAVVLASEGSKNLIGMRFDNNEYPYEKMGFDGNEFTVGFVQPGLRSVLGNFLRENENTFEYGILGGVLSTSWELLEYDEKVGKLKCGGTEKINDVKHYECSYKPKKSDLKVKFFFHPETFRHVRTEYNRVVSGGQGRNVLGQIGSADSRINNSARQSETRFTLIEDFSDFKEVNNLTLPHEYKLSYEILSGNGTTIIEWTMQLSNFVFNEKIDPKQFKVDTY